MSLTSCLSAVFLLHRAQHLQCFRNIYVSPRMVKAYLIFVTYATYDKGVKFSWNVERKKIFQSNAKDKRNQDVFFYIQCVILYSMCDSALSFVSTAFCSGVKFATKCIGVNNWQISSMGQRDKVCQTNDLLSSSICEPWCAVWANGSLSHMCRDVIVGWVSTY